MHKRKGYFILLLVVSVSYSFTFFAPEVYNCVTKVGPVCTRWSTNEFSVNEFEVGIGTCSNNTGTYCRLDERKRIRACVLVFFFFFFFSMTSLPFYSTWTVVQDEVHVFLRVDASRW